MIWKFSWKITDKIVKKKIASEINLVIIPSDITIDYKTKRAKTVWYDREIGQQVSKTEYESPETDPSTYKS